MPRYYAGIGSRETPQDVLEWMYKIGAYLADKDWILRSGGADGADLAFERGCDSAFFGEKEIYLPWAGFNNSQSKYAGVAPEATELTSRYHPAWDRLSASAKLMMARNAYQVLGLDLHTPSSFVLCWTKGGIIFGGTGQAMRIATDNNIPIFNLWHDNAKSALKQWLREQE